MSSVKIIDAFARAAVNYDNHADVQVVAASRLAAYMDANTRDLTDGTILEVGCGTGLFTRRLLDMFTGRTFSITDICPQMLDKCQARISETASSNSVSFALRDAERPAEGDEQHALIVAAFALQWTENLRASLDALSNGLVKDGKLFFSLPASGSFPEWKSLCLRAGVAFTANDLPRIADLRNFAAERGYKLSLYEESIKVGHRSLHDFLQSLKSLGASTTFQSPTLSVPEMRRLLSYARTLHPDSFEVTYNVLFGNYTRLR